MPNLDVEYVRFYSIDNGHSLTRKIAVVDGVPFYQSSGVNSGQQLAGTFLPFLGIEVQGQNSGWFRKPGFVNELEALSTPLIELLENHYNEHDADEIELFSKDLIQRFATIKCMLISSLLEDETPAPSFLSQSAAPPINPSFWRRVEGIRLKAYLMRQYAAFYQENQYCLRDNGLIIDTRSTARFSYEQRSRQTALNRFLEGATQKPLSLGFNAAAFSDNLSEFNLHINPNPDWIPYPSIPHSRVKPSQVKKAKKHMAQHIETAQSQGLAQPLIEPFIPEEPVKYSKLIWPETLDELNITEEERDETEQHILCIYDVVHSSLHAANKKFMETGSSDFYRRTANTFTTKPDSDQPIKTFLEIKYLFDGQIVVYPSRPQAILYKPEKRFEIFKVYNVTSGEWMVLKTSSPERLRYELLSLSGKAGISQIAGFVLAPWTINGNTINSKIIQKESIIEKFYPQSFSQRFLKESHTINLDQKAQYMLQLLKGLANIHALSCQQDDLSPISIPAFHGDIKWENIMYHPAADKPYIIDFDNFGKWDTIFHSSMNTPPETAAFLSALPADCMRKNDVFQFNAKNGQAMDLWNMALIFATILTKPYSSPYYSSSVCVPPFYFFHNRLNRPDQKARYYLDLMQLKQSEIDAEIEQILERLPDTAEGKQLFCLWSIVIAMLKVDPAKRTPAATLAQVLETQINCQFAEGEIVDYAPNRAACSSI